MALVWCVSGMTISSCVRSMINLLSLCRAIVVALVVPLGRNWSLSYNLSGAMVVMVMDMGLMTRARTERTTYAVTAPTTVTIDASSSVAASTSSTPSITSTARSTTTQPPSTDSSEWITFSRSMNDDRVRCVRMMMMAAMVMRFHSTMNYWFVNNWGWNIFGRFVDHNDLRSFLFFLWLRLWLLFFLFFFSAGRWARAWFVILILIFFLFLLIFFLVLVDSHLVV